MPTSGTQAAKARKRLGKAPVFLDRLESGFLLFKTPQGLVRVDLSFRQRIYLLWTFRNFRQLSTRLLNSHQKALVDALFRERAGAVSLSHDPLLIIGVVEDFVAVTAQTSASADHRPTREQERKDEAHREPEKVAALVPEPTPLPISVHGSSPGVAWSKLGTTLGALFFCAISAVAWHRLQGIPGSQAQTQPRLQPVSALPSPVSPPAQKPPTVAEIPVALAPPQATPLPPVLPKPVVQPTFIAAATPTPKLPLHIHTTAQTADLPLFDQDSRIQASRPPLRFAYPVYPDVRTRGVVVLTAQLDSEGTVRGVKIVSGNPALAAAAVRAVRQWRYSPYLKDGQPVATDTNMVISFISEDAISMSFPPSIPLSH